MQQIGGNAACSESADAEPAGGQTATAVDLVVDVDQPVTAGAAVANAVGGEPSDDNIAKWKNRNRGRPWHRYQCINSGRGVSTAPPFFKNLAFKLRSETLPGSPVPGNMWCEPERTEAIF